MPQFQPVACKGFHSDHFYSTSSRRYYRKCSALL